MSAAAKESARRALRAGSRIASQDLIHRGVPRTTFQNWVRLGVLRASGERGVYRTTRKTESSIARACSRS